MVYKELAYLCGALIFLVLLSQKYKLVTTIIIYGTAFLSGFIVSGLTEAIFGDSEFIGSLFIIAHSLILFAISLFTASNNPAIKLYLTVLCISNFSFASIFSETLVGVLPIQKSGVFAIILSAAIFVLIYLVSGICLYRHIQYFSDRFVSGFDIVITLIQILPIAFSLGFLDFIFKSGFLLGRIVMALTVYFFIVFCFRSVYHGAKFREKTMINTAHNKLISAQSAIFTDMYANVRSLKAESRQNEYVLNSISIMMLDGQTESVAPYIASRKLRMQENVMLQHYHENDYINAVIATNAAYAQSQGIDFEGNISNVNPMIKTSEFCIICDEILKRSCERLLDSLEDNKRLRLTVTSTEDKLIIEVIYNIAPIIPEKWSFRDKSIPEIIAHLLDEKIPKDKDFNNTEDILAMYSGTLSISSTGDDTIITVAITF